MARSKLDARGKDGAQGTMADPLAMDPLGSMAYMVARGGLEERLAGRVRNESAGRTLLRPMRSAPRSGRIERRQNPARRELRP
jgi:hypothetical protein